jgi:geranylgeranyl transferase type-2 subunit beta
LTYLERLALRLTVGLSHTPEARRARHLDWLQRAQQPDGGFTGREGPSDLYYTGFALRSLAILDGLSTEVCERAAEYLRGNLHRRTSVVDFFSFLYSAGLLQVMGHHVLADAEPGWEGRIAVELDAFRTQDGGYAKMPGALSGSTYHTFLMALCHELIERPLPAPERVRQFVASRRRDDGGYVEIGAMKRSGTNPTAAAIGTLHVLDGQHFNAEPEVIRFLLDMVSPEGGLRANGRVPLADLLSTFTALWTLEELGASEQVDYQSVQRYLEMVEQPDGGFRAGVWDQQADAEYTFYGLGVMALLSRAGL